MKHLLIQEFKKVDTPSLSARSGFMKIYFKDDGNLYKLDENGNESLIGGNTDYKGYFQTANNLISTYPTGQPGWYALVGSTDTFRVWDNALNQWKNSGEVGFYMGTYAQIKQLKENNQLIPGAKYVITDFQSIVPIGNTEPNTVYYTGPTEKLILTATDTNTFSSEVSSLSYPQDVIYFDFDGVYTRDDYSYAYGEGYTLTVTGQNTFVIDLGQDITNINNLYVYHKSNSNNDFEIVIHSGIGYTYTDLGGYSYEITLTGYTGDLTQIPSGHIINSYVDGDKLIVLNSTQFELVTDSDIIINDLLYINIYDGINGFYGDRNNLGIGSGQWNIEQIGTNRYLITIYSTIDLLLVSEYGYIDMGYSVQAINTKGIITYRKDTNKSIETIGYDFRNARTRLYNINTTNMLWGNSGYNEGSLVYYNQYIWKCILTHNTPQTPVSGSKYWIPLLYYPNNNPILLGNLYLGLDTLYAGNVYFDYPVFSTNSGVYNDSEVYNYFHSTTSVATIYPVFISQTSSPVNVIHVKLNFVDGGIFVNSSVYQEININSGFYFIISGSNYKLSVVSGINNVIITRPYNLSINSINNSTIVDPNGVEINVCYTSNINGISSSKINTMYNTILNNHMYQSQFSVINAVYYSKILSFYGSAANGYIFNTTLGVCYGCTFSGEIYTLQQDLNYEYYLNAFLKIDYAFNAILRGQFSLMSIGNIIMSSLEGKRNLFDVKNITYVYLTTDNIDVYVTHNVRGNWLSNIGTINSPVVLRMQNVIFNGLGNNTINGSSGLTIINSILGSIISSTFNNTVLQYSNIGQMFQCNVAGGVMINRVNVTAIEQSQILGNWDNITGGSIYNISTNQFKNNHINGILQNVSLNSATHVAADYSCSINYTNDGQYIVEYYNSNTGLIYAPVTS